MGKRTIYARHQIAKGLDRPRKGGLDSASPKLLRKSKKAKKYLTHVKERASLAVGSRSGSPPSWWRISLARTLDSVLWQLISSAPEDEWLDFIDASRSPHEAYIVEQLWLMAVSPPSEGGLGLQAKVDKDYHHPTCSIGTPGELIVFSILWKEWTPPPFRDLGDKAYRIRMEEDRDPIDLAINVGGVFVYNCVKSSSNQCTLQSSKAFYSTVSKDVMQSEHPTIVLRWRVSYVDPVMPVGNVRIQYNVLRNWTPFADQLRTDVNALRA